MRPETTIEVRVDPGTGKPWYVREVVPAALELYHEVHNPLVYVKETRTIEAPNVKVRTRIRKGYAKLLSKKITQAVMKALNTPGIPSGR